MFENIPAELRALPQWVAAGSDKVPINPRTGKKADPSDPSTGGTFAEAVSTGMKNIGFILGANDPFVIIDLDDPFTRNDKSIITPTCPDYLEALERVARHNAIYNNFETYTELSQSGKGVHLVMRGTIPCPVKRDKVEIYFHERYMIFTGNVLKHLPVADCQPMLDKMFEELGRLVSPDGELIEEEATQDDSAIWTMATRASNAEKFIKLCNGQWQDMKVYPSQSEADYALISMLAFYTRSNEQVRRMFRQTELAKRKKATRNNVYIDRSLRRIRAREAPLVDISKLAPIIPPPPVAGIPVSIPTEAALSIKEMSLPQVDTPTESDVYSFPVGIVGEVAKYILSSAIRPIPEVALCGAIALCAGIVARSYNISGTGLNQYIILLAKTGRGKEGAASGIDNLIAAVRRNIPMADQFLGPAAFASGQAIVKVLDKKPCFVSVLGEFGLTLQQICDPRASGAEIMYKKVLLDIFAKSGHSKVLRSSAYSDSEKDTRMVQAPNVSLLGESTPENFFAGLDVAHIAEGLIPRFSIVEYMGKRPSKNPNAFHAPDDSLVEAMGQIVTVAVNSAQNNTCCPVSVTPEASAIFDLLDKEADSRINDDIGEVEGELWNRSDLKAQKLGALIAAGVNPHAPTITGEIAKWAVDFVRREIRGVMRRFAAGDVGTGEAKQEAEIRRLFSHFQTMTERQRKNHRCPDALLASQVCPANYLTIYTRRLACFQHDKRGSARALSETLSDMVRREVFEMIPLQQLQTEFKMKSAIYYPGPAW
jgi:hypothetical protein